MPSNVLPGKTDSEVLRAAVYWLMAIVIVIATKGNLGYRNEATKLSHSPESAPAPDGQS